MSWSRYPAFDTNRITLHSHDDLVARLHVDNIRALEHELSLCVPSEPFHPAERACRRVAKALQHAVENRKARILFMGAHPIKLGLSRYLCNLIANGWFTHVATTGAGLIHDWQLTDLDCTDEDVAATLAEGKFGFWEELDVLNKLVNSASASGYGLGEKVGAKIAAADGAWVILPSGKTWEDVRDYSIAGACWAADVPFTVHATIGTDILAMYPSYNGAAWGTTSYRDFRILVEAVTKSDGGVFINTGSAVTGPEVFLKSMSVAANVGEMPKLTTAVFDRYPLPANWRERNFTRNDAAYYWRPLKAVLKRAVAGDSHASHYVQGDFKRTIPRLWTLLEA